MLRLIIEQKLNRRNSAERINTILATELIPSRFLKAADIGNGRTMTVRDLIVEKVGDSDKPCMQFKECSKGLVLNKTNIELLSNAFGNETDSWIGKRIGLKVEKVDFQGRKVNGIRIYGPQPSELPSIEEKPVEEDVGF